MEMSEQPTLKRYKVKLVGGFVMSLQAKSEDHAEGLATGELRAKLPQFIINGVEVTEEE